MLTIAKCSVLLALVNAAFVNAQSGGSACSVDVTKDGSKGQIVYLQSNQIKWRYPEGNALKPGSDGHLVRIGCPGGTVQLRDNVTVWKTAIIDCVGGPAVKIPDTLMFGLFNQFECSGYQPPVSRLTNRKTPNGKLIAEVGYPLGPSDFLTIIDELIVSRLPRGFIPRWARYTLTNLPTADTPLQKKMRKGPLSRGISYKQAYNRTLQREALKESLGDEVANFIMPDKGTQGFVPAKLANPEDFFYEAQKNATFYYELSTPVWNSVAEGNWQLTGKLVRDLARQRKQLEVYSGTYLALYLPNKKGMVTYIRLPGDLRPAQFLFRLVVDKTSKQGVVLITVNNPFLKEADKYNVICTPVKGCAAALQAKFTNLQLGYTYCCNPAEFKSQAKLLGMPDDAISSLTLLKM